MENIEKDPVILNHGYKIIPLGVAECYNCGRRHLTLQHRTDFDECPFCHADMTYPLGYCQNCHQNITQDPIIGYLHTPCSFGDTQDEDI